MRAKLRSHLTYANVMATIAVFMALGGGVAWALGANSVKSKHIARDVVQGVDVNEASLDSDILQSRVGGSCQEGEAIQSVLATGQVICETALQGAPGTPGAPGSPGAPGQPGAPGADGTSFTWQGSWDGGLEYAPNDVISHQGSSWIATKGDPCEPGAEGCAQWEPLAQKGEQGEPGEDGEAGPGALGLAFIQPETDNQWRILGEVDHLTVFAKCHTRLQTRAALRLGLQSSYEGSWPYHDEVHVTEDVSTGGAAPVPQPPETRFVNPTQPGQINPDEILFVSPEVADGSTESFVHATSFRDNTALIDKQVVSLELYADVNDGAGVCRLYGTAVPGGFT